MFTKYPTNEKPSSGAETTETNKGCAEINGQTDNPITLSITRIIVWPATTK